MGHDAMDTGAGKLADDPGHDDDQRSVENDRSALDERQNSEEHCCQDPDDHYAKGNVRDIMLAWRSKNAVNESDAHRDRREQYAAEDHAWNADVSETQDSLLRSNVVSPHNTPQDVGYSLHPRSGQV